MNVQHDMNIGRYVRIGRWHERHQCAVRHTYTWTMKNNEERTIDKQKHINETLEVPMFEHIFFLD